MGCGSMDGGFELRSATGLLGPGDGTEERVVQPLQTRKNNKEENALGNGSIK